MLPITTKSLVPFRPVREGDDAPTYHIEVPTLYSRARYHAELQGLGVSYPNDAEFFGAVRAGVKAIVADDEQPALIELVDYVESLYRKGEAPEDDLALYRSLESQLQPLWPPLQALVKRRAMYLEVTPIVACRLFLKKAEGSAVALEFADDGGLTDETMEALPFGDVIQVGIKARSLMELGRDREKNSESPSRSPAIRANTTAGASRRRAPKVGKSSATGTTKTPASD